MGILYSFNIVSNTFLKLYDFDGTLHGMHPECGLTEAANGKIFGVTSSGGVPLRSWQGGRLPSSLAGSSR